MKFIKKNNGEYDAFVTINITPKVYNDFKYFCKYNTLVPVKRIRLYIKREIKMWRESHPHLFDNDKEDSDAEN